MHKFAALKRVMRRKILIILLPLIVLSGAMLVIFCFKLTGRIDIKDGDDEAVIYLPTGSGYKQVMDSISRKAIIKDPGMLKWVAERKNYPARIKPGKYIITKNCSYIELINMLRSGRQSPVRVTFNNIRSLNELAGKIGRLIEADSLEILNFLSNENNYSSDGFSRETIISVFIPDTYELFWNTTAEGFYRRMLREYRTFWNEERLARAKEKNLTPVEVSILASIIDDEVAKAEEKPKIAGVYLNRLKRGIPLQACPTIKFALNDFTITRVLSKHLLVDSPYNTYRHNGFPPGPISCPSVQGINAVLNAEEHDYLYFAAKSDFSGYHNFSATLSQHNRYAAEYQRELNRRRIFR